MVTIIPAIDHPRRTVVGGRDEKFRSVSASMAITDTAVIFNNDVAFDTLTLQFTNGSGATTMDFYAAFDDTPTFVQVFVWDVVAREHTQNPTAFTSGLFSIFIGGARRVRITKASATSIDIAGRFHKSGHAHVGLAAQ